MQEETTPARTFTLDISLPGPHDELLAERDPELGTHYLTIEQQPWPGGTVGELLRLLAIEAGSEYLNIELLLGWGVDATAFRLTSAD